MTLTTSDYAVLTLVYEYLREMNKKAITYDGLTTYAKKRKRTEYKNETIQRSLRRLAEHGFFDRKYVTSYSTSRRIVLYVPTRKFDEFFKVKR
ncbi:MAG: hypothetical protein QW251_03650 [Desulfurococcaceae archaeon]